MSKLLLISPKNRTVYNFRGDLIRRLQKEGYDVWVTGPNQDNIEEIQKLGVEFVEIPSNKNGINPLDDLRYLSRLYRLIKRERFDATLGYTIKPVIYGSIAAKLAGCKNINAMITGVGYLFTATDRKAKILRSVAQRLYKSALRCAHKVIFQNQDDRDEFVANGLVGSQKCYCVNGSGVNMAKFTVAEFPEITTFLMISRALLSKGVREYLEAARIVKQKYPATRLMYLGKIEEMPDCLSEAEIQAYIRDGVIGYYPETNCVQDYIAQCSVYVLPSYREGTPRTVLEAMAMGRPIITSDAPGCRNTVIDGKTGFLTRVKDVEAIASKMEYFINHSSQIQEMGQRSYQLCKEKFEVDAVNDAMMDIIKLIR